MGSMVVFDCGQKRLRFVHFHDDPAKHDGRFADFATSMTRTIRAGINREPSGSNQDIS
jgi:hypothetical protein